MTVAVFQEDSYLQALTAKVTSVDGEWVELDKTIFYAESGGQPGDTGSMTAGGKEVRVIDTKKGETPGAIRHELETADHGLSEGDDFESRRRRDLCNRRKNAHKIEDFG